MVTVLFVSEIPATLFPSIVLSVIVTVVSTARSPVVVSVIVALDKLSVPPFTTIPPPTMSLIERLSIVEDALVSDTAVPVAVDILRSRNSASGLPFAFVSLKMIPAYVVPVISVFVAVICESERYIPVCASEIVVDARENVTKSTIEGNSVAGISETNSAVTVDESSVIQP